MPHSDQTLLYAWLIPLFLINGFLCPFFGLNVPKRVAGALATAAVFASFGIAWVLFQHVLAADEAHKQITVYLAPWLNVPTDPNGIHSFTVNFEMLIDPLSVLMMLIITGVGFLIHVYSIGYMSGERAYARFFAYLSLFTFAMLMLVTSDNLVQMFFGWEGVGLASYLLIGFWYTDANNAKAGNKAFIVNRIGDFGLLCGMFLLVYYTGALDWTGIANGAQNLVSPSDAAQVHLWPIGGGQFQDASFGGLRVPLSWLQPNKAWTITGATAAQADAVARSAAVLLGIDVW